MELLTKALESYGINGYIIVFSTFVIYGGVKLAINKFTKDDDARNILFSETTKDILQTNKKLLDVNHQISKDSIQAVNAIATMLKEFFISHSFNHKEIVTRIDTNHKEFVNHFDDIKKKIEQLHYK